ncbi:MAG: hypothetical protein NWT02_02665 [Opitutales bacterium]|jgi:hypothetical protein|nr:hypothetical protein [Opitutales bacterium]MDP4643357.1 hypothetical protein [Opitutales bacterium]MDP4778047.1 hypothetical protein [Opitutales bacterium]MDP4883698.1 hypothetical protein [Opitutales bacterium]MDP5079780.1 hypothetical protein [Opitutales bacterium]
MITGQIRLVLLICLIYILAWLGYYGQITLGQFLTPEEAGRVAAALSPQNDQPNTLYQTILHFGASFAEEKQAVVTFARSINVAALLLGTLLIAAASGQFWKSHRAACIAGLLLGLNPILVFRVGEISPTILATSCVAIAVARLLHWLRHPSMADSFIISSALTLGTAFETGLIGLALCWPIVALLYPNRNRVIHVILAAITPVIFIALCIVSKFQLQQAIDINTADLLVRSYTFFNNFESYDALSYHLHGHIHALLFLNPIHWGALLMLATVGAYARKKDGHTGRSVIAFFSILFLVGLAYVLNDGGSRLRMTLSPLLAIFSAGSILVIPRIWQHAGRLTKRNIIVGTALIASLTYSAAFNSHDKSDFMQDYAFLAQANVKMGKNEAATIWAEKLLIIQPERQDMHSVLIQAQFNEWALTSKPTPLSVESTKAYLEDTEKAEKNAAIPDAIRGIYLWKLKNQEAALELWHSHAESSALAQLCLYWTQQENPLRNSVSDEDPYAALLHTSLKISRDAIGYSDEEKRLDNLFSTSH